MMDYSQFAIGATIAATYEDRVFYARVLRVRTHFAEKEYELLFKNARHPIWYPESQLAVWDAVKMCGGDFNRKLWI